MRNILHGKTGDRGTSNSPCTCHYLGQSTKHGLRISKYICSHLTTFLCSLSRNGKRTVDHDDKAAQIQPHRMSLSALKPIPNHLYEMDFFHQRKTKQPTRTLKPWTDPLAKKRVETPPITTTTTTKKYDSESGQVFSESEIRFNRKQYSDWIGELRTPELTKKAVLKGTGKGARSLAAMAQSKVATQFRNLTPDHFAMVPWSSAEEIWRDLIDRYHASQF